MKISAVLTLVTCAISFFLNSITFAQAPNFEWAKSAGGIYEDVGQSICNDPSGNVISVGYSENSVLVFNTHTITGTPNVGTYIVKHDVSGNVIWAKNIERTHYHRAGHKSKVKTDKFGNIYVVGHFSSPSITVGGLTLYSSSSIGGQVFFVVKYDANGNVLWAKTPTSGESETVYDIDVDNVGNIVIIGFYQGTSIIFDSQTITNTAVWATNLAFIVKFDKTGIALWAKGTSDLAGNTYFNNVSSDKFGNFYITGTFVFSITFGPYTLSAPTSRDVLHLKYDSSGNLVWAKQFGSNGGDYDSRLLSDSLGNNYIFTFCAGSITFGSTTYSSGGRFISKFDSSGNLIWAKKSENIGEFAANIDSKSNLYASDISSGRALLGTSSFMPVDSLYPGITTIKIDSAGNFIWAIRAYNFDRVKSLTVDETGSVYVTGSFSSPSMIFGLDTLINPYPVTPDDEYDEGHNIFIFKISSLATNIYSKDLKNEDIVIYPNPSNGIYYLNVNSVNSKTKDLEIEVINTIGQKVFESKSIDSKKIEIDLSQYPSGTYFVKIYNEEIISTKKIIKL